MRRKINFLPAAEEDFDEIWFYIAARDEGAADRLIDRLRRSTARLSDHPRSAPVRPELGFEQRGLSAHGYILFYTFDEESVDIIRVFDARRDWVTLFLNA